MEEVLLNKARKPDLTWLEPLRNPIRGKSKAKYCCFHQDHGHLIDKSFELKEEIEALIRREKLMNT